MIDSAPAATRVPRRNQLELLFVRSAGRRPALTPGELYRRMSAEFKESRAPDHGNCVMPMVACNADSPLGVNWGLEQLTARCMRCEAVALEIAWRYAETYDVRRPHLQPSLSPATAAKDVPQSLMVESQAA
jgi:hypothetical protein